MPWRTVGLRPRLESRPWLGVFVVGLLISGCASGPAAGASDKVLSSLVPAVSASSDTPSALPLSNPSATAAGHATPVPMELVSTLTGAPDLFSRPDGIGLDLQGDLYVADAGNSRVQKLDGEGHLLAKWGSNGSKAGQFDCEYCGLAVDGSGNVYVTDAGNRRVQKFDRHGKFLTQWGDLGNKDGQFLGPFGIAVDRQGKVYVGDHVLSRVQKFDGHGAFLATWGSRGSGNGQFSDELADIAVDASGNIYVTDRQNGVQKFDPKMQFVARVTDCGDDRPVVAATGIALDPGGNLYVYDLTNNRICKYDGSGIYLSALGGLTDAVGLIAIDRQGDIYAAEPFIDVILKFRQP